MPMLGSDPGARGVAAQTPRRSSPILRSEPPRSSSAARFVPADRSTSREMAPDSADQARLSNVSEGRGARMRGSNDSVAGGIAQEGSNGFKGSASPRAPTAPRGAEPDEYEMLSRPTNANALPKLDIKGALTTTDELAHRLGGVEVSLNSSRHELGLNVSVLSAENEVIRKVLEEMQMKLDLLLDASQKIAAPNDALVAKMDGLVAEVRQAVRSPTATTALLLAEPGGGRASFEPRDELSNGTPRRQPPQGDTNGEVDVDEKPDAPSSGEAAAPAAAPTLAVVPEGDTAPAAPAAHPRLQREDSVDEPMIGAAARMAERDKFREVYEKQDDHGGDWVQSVEERLAAHHKATEKSRDIFQKIANSAYFQVLSVVVILAAVISMAVQTEMSVRENVGISLCIEGKGPPVEAGTMAEFFNASEWILLVWMFIELIINVKAVGALFSGEGYEWNIFDMVIICGSIAQKGFTGINLSSLRVMKIARVLKFVRVFKALRAFKSCSALLSGVRKLLLCLVGSLPSLFWAFIIIAMFLFLMAIMMMQGIEVYYESRFEEMPLGECRPGGLGNSAWDGSPTYNEIFPKFVVDPENDTHTEQVQKLYGTLDRTIMTLFSTISGGSEWQIVMDPLARISTAFFILWVVFIFFSIYGVLNVFTGAFCESAVAAAAADTQTIMDQELADLEDCQKCLRAAFARIDIDGSGSLSEPELGMVLTDPSVVVTLSKIGLQASESRGLFKLLDEDRSGILSCDEFVDGCVSLKGGARRVDIIGLMTQNRRLSKTMNTLMELCDTMWTNLEQGINNKLPASSPTSPTSPKAAGSDPLPMPSLPEGAEERDPEPEAL